MKVSVSLISYNTKELFRKCLTHLLSIKGKNELEIFVVDNNSPDGSGEMIEKEFKKVDFYQSPDNTGFAKGQNINLRKSKSPYILILNPDTKIPDDSIDKMVVFMEGHPSCGIASCRIIGYDGQLHSNGGDLPFGLALISWLFNLEMFGIKQNFHRLEKEYYTKIQSVGWVGGTFMMVRQEVFEKIGYFDEKYFMYFEDVDLCFRAKKAGFDIMLNPEVEIKHMSGASSANPRLSQWKGELKGLLIFYKKNSSSNIVYWLVKLLVYKSTILRMLAFGIIGRFAAAKTYGKIIFSI